jgi:hypothetical protein
MERFPRNTGEQNTTSANNSAAASAAGGLGRECPDAVLTNPPRRPSRIREMPRYRVVLRAFVGWPVETLGWRVCESRPHHP